MVPRIEALAQQPQRVQVIFDNNRENQAQVGARPMMRPLQAARRERTRLSLHDRAGARKPFRPQPRTAEPKAGGTYSCRLALLAASGHGETLRSPF